MSLVYFCLPKLILQNTFQTITTDVLVIGSGGAGVRTAIELFDHGVDVQIVGKSKENRAHTSRATGGINAVLNTMDPKDTVDQHIADTLKDGNLLGDPTAVELLCRYASGAVRELEKWGVNFHKEKDGRISQRFFGAATYRRACFVGDHTGEAILTVLTQQAKKRKIPFHNEVYIFSLLKHEGTVNGAVGFDMNSGEIIIFHAKVVVLATGGHSRIFNRSSSRFWENNGDGISLAYDAGASFIDMEMFQYHPTGMLKPDEAVGGLVTEAVRGEGGILLNAKGKRFMEKYDKERMELSARDVVARAIAVEVAAGRGTENDGVWLDITSRSKKYIQERLPKVYEQFMHYANVDISKERVEVAPTAHYSMGGIKIDHATGSAGIDGLFAVGEVTGGIHGGNRLGGNSLAEIVVFGRHTGIHIASIIGDKRLVPIQDSTIHKKIKKLKSLVDKDGENAIEVKKKLQKIMKEYVWVIRKKSGLTTALKKINGFREVSFNIENSLQKNEQLHAALDVRHILTTAQMVIESALMREESRGAHYRVDYPESNESWKKNIICKPIKGGVKLSTKGIPEIPPKIMKLIETSTAKTHLLE